MDINRQEVTLKVADFGMARVGALYTAPKDSPFPVKWAAIEVLKYNRYTTKSGIILNSYISFSYNFLQTFGHSEL